MWRSRKLCSSASATCLWRKFNPSKPHCRRSPSAVSPQPRPPRSILSPHAPLRRLSSDIREPGAAVSWSFYSSSSDSGASAHRCWNCGSGATSASSSTSSGSLVPEPFLACRSCLAVQPVDPSVDYFQIFGLEKGFEIKVDNLERKYKDWQKKLHPDLVHSKSEREKVYAAEQSARVIDAYQTLTRPLSRASYLLQLEGIHVDEEQTVSNPELLAEVMEIREAVEEANDSQALEHMKSQLQQKLENSSNSFWEAFKTQNFEVAVTSYQRMTYYERAIREIVKKL